MSFLPPSLPLYPSSFLLFIRSINKDILRVTCALGTILGMWHKTNFSNSNNQIMVSALLHLILPTTRNVQGHGVPHLTSSCSSCCHDNLITGITQQYLPPHPPFFFFFSYTPYLLPSALGFHAKNVTCGTKCSTIQMRAQP